MSSSIGSRRKYYEFSTDDQANEGKRRRVGRGLDELPKWTQKPTLPPERPRSIQCSLPIWQEGVEAKHKCFTYKPLGKREIRLLRLHPGSMNEPIKVSLSVANLDNRPEYAALSYCWGDPEPLSQILLSNEDGADEHEEPHQFNVRSNVCEALRYLRDWTHSRVLWIDTLCIEQENVTERNQELEKLSEIFEKAHETIAWIGKETASSKWALTHLRHVFQPSYFDSAMRDNVKFGNPDVILFVSALLEICSRPFFQRAWIIQEIAHSKHVTLVCGSDQVAWQDFTTVVELVLQHKTAIEARNAYLVATGRPEAQIDLSPLDQAASLIDVACSSLRKSVEGNIIEHSRTLLELVLATREFRATDPKDRVFALFGLASWVARSPGARQTTIIKPDYGKDCLEVFQEFIEYSVDESKSLDIILQPWAPLSRPKPGSGMEVSPSVSIPSWIAVAQDMPSGCPLDSSQLSCSQRTRVNGDSMIGGCSSYHASARYEPKVEFGPLIRRKTRRVVEERSKSPTSTSHEPDNTQTDPKSTFGTLKNRVLHTDGLELGTITDLSIRMTDGIVPRECLEMGGMSLTKGLDQLQHVSDKEWEKLCRTLVADRDSQGGSKIYRFSLAFFNIFRKVLKLRGMDTVEMLQSETDTNIAEFLGRVRDTTCDRRMFQSAVNNYDENLLGLAPRGAEVGDKIVVLFGCSVPVILRPDLIAGDGYTKIVGPAFVYGKMEGEALAGVDQESLDQRTQSFHIV